MLFHTPAFLAFFVAFLAFYLPARGTRFAIPVIVVFSSIFYGSWNWKFLPLLWITIVVDYTLGNMLAATTDAMKRRWLVAGSIATNLGILGYFKYWNFAVASALPEPYGSRLVVADIILPLGISFYVFQSMSYVLDVYRRTQQPMRSLIDFAAFVTFFPHLIAGPIQRVHQLVPQLLRPDPITFKRVASGVLIFASGMFRKGLADALAAFHDPIFKDLEKATPPQAVAALFTFGLQIYLDFSGYSEMAIGLARALGVDLIQNFNAPYLAASVRDFWRRWHISLSLWLRDYLYISLGGSRVRLPVQVGNLVITMTVCGLWHGAGWNFLIWGFLHGVYLAVNAVFTRIAGEWIEARRWARVAVTVVGIPLTYLVVTYAWVYFRLPTFADATFMNGLIGAFLLHPRMPNVPIGIFGIFAIVLALDLVTRFRGEIFPLTDPLTPPRAVAYGAIAGALFVGALVLIAGVPERQFIYFNF